jgi:lipopolysaccharide export system protein LptA
MALTLILVCWGFLFAYYGHYSEADKIAYDQMVNGEKEESELTETQISRQKRQGVQKSLFFNNRDQRMELNIASGISEITLEKTDGRIEVVEHLTDVVCRLQESLETVLVMKAKSAVYRYKGGVFSAKNVQLQRYAGPDLIAEGSAENVTFSLDGKSLDFKADYFNGDFVSNGQEGKITVAADQVRFQPGLVVLSGHAIVGHQGYTVKADEMFFSLSEEGKTVIKTIVADGDIQLQDSDFTVFSDHAVFQRSPEGKEGILPGTITLTCYAPDAFCRVVNREGDAILSNEIVVDTMKEEAVFAHPKGNLNSIGWTFSAQKMVWNGLASKLTLSGHVEMFSDNGKIEVAKEVVAVLTKSDGKQILKGIHADGEVVLTHSDHTLKSYGSLTVDHQKMEIKLQSPPDRQVFFEDAKGQIYADKAFIKYDFLDRKMSPNRIVLQGNAKIENRFDRSETDQTKVSQYVISDRVDFIPQTKEMTFKADKDKRVLFFDKENNLEVSAPKIKVIRDKAAGKDTIQGFGNVRFNLATGEFEQLRRDFSFDKKNEGKKS